MARNLLFTLGVLALALSIILSTGPSLNAQTMECIDGCLEQYVNCVNSPGGTPNCDDQYDQCAENCLGRIGGIL